ncbi:hypothetical protein ACIBSV_12030 [Embleya sp. NPDC050154]|uniref:hypothetical protein n=1 Tax=Embleya sp. NPDC050154 TaxID=3363988 RepID=UPI0037A271CA
MSTETAPTTWAAGDWVTARMPDGDRVRGQVTAMRQDDGRWLAEVVPSRPGGESVTVPADELWPDA